MHVDRHRRGVVDRARAVPVGRRRERAESTPLPDVAVDAGRVRVVPREGGRPTRTAQGVRDERVRVGDRRVLRRDVREPRHEALRHRVPPLIVRHDDDHVGPCRRPDGTNGRRRRYGRSERAQAKGNGKRCDDREREQEPPHGFGIARMTRGGVATSSNRVVVSRENRRIEPAACQMALRIAWVEGGAMEGWRSALNGDTLDWLLEEDTPAVRHLALRWLLHEPEHARRVRGARSAAMKTGPIASTLAAQHPDGYWVTPGPGYGPKYTGTVWSLDLPRPTRGGRTRSHGSATPVGTSSTTRRRRTVGSAGARRTAAWCIA